MACAALTEPSRRLQHFLLEVPDRSTIDSAYQRVTKAGIPIAHRIGVHPNDSLYTFHTISPSGFQAELGAEGQLVADDDRPIGQFEGMSAWGHEMPIAQKLRMLKPVSRAMAGRLLERFGG